MHALIEMSYSKGCNDGPVYVHSFMLLARGCGFALALKTILKFGRTSTLSNDWFMWHVEGAVSGGRFGRNFHYSFL